MQNYSEIQKKKTATRSKEPPPRNLHFRNSDITGQKVVSSLSSIQILLYCDNPSKW